MVITPKQLLCGVLLIELSIGLGLLSNEERFDNSYDADAYFQQLEAWPDYASMDGDTGPIAYPGGHALFYAILKRLFGWDSRKMRFAPDNSGLPSSQGSTERAAGRIIAIKAVFLVLRLLFVVLLMEMYKALGVNSSGLLGSLPLLAAVFFWRRSREVFICGCFNDSLVATLLVATVVLASRGRLLAASAMLSAALSVKLSAVLMGPGLLFVLLRLGDRRTIASSVAVGLAVQLVVGLQPLLTNPVAYLARSFNLVRTFEQRQSVPFYWLPAAVFDSPLFHYALLLCHLLGLAFLWIGPWRHALARPLHGKDACNEALKEQTGCRNLSREIAFILLSSHLLGVIFARSLHFQFAPWCVPFVPWMLAYSTPGLFQIVDGRAEHDVTRNRVLFDGFVCALLYVALAASWEYHPPAVMTSFTLTVAHFALLCRIMWMRGL